MKFPHHRLGDLLGLASGIWLALAVVVAAAEPANVGLDFSTAVKMSREYLASDDDDRRDELKSRLATYAGDWEAVINALQQRSYPQVKPGYYPDYTFRSAAAKEKFPRDLLYLIVPENYDAKQPTGLIVFMHGGGLMTSRDAAAYTLRLPEPGERASDGEYRNGKMLAATGMITVGPSAPGKGESYYRWCLRASEEYLVEVIQDCKSRFNIDPHRVFLLGHSMGGFGAYHHALRQPDRFAGIIVSSGSWDCGYWPVVRGTQMCIVHGTNDAVKGERWHHTDIQHARLTHSLFHRDRLDHKYYEHNGYHGFSENRDDVARYFATAKDLRRDPYFPQVAVATPQGFAWTYLNRVRHNRWLTLDETTSGEIRVDWLAAVGDDFDTWKLENRRPTRRGAIVEATNRGNNRIDVTTQNVAKFTVWLHPKMIDVRQPVTIAVDDSLRVTSLLQPSLVTALESYERRTDWGLIYPMKVELRITEEE